MPTPEALARQNIDAQLAACGWIVQDRGAINLFAGLGVAMCEFPLETGYADYLLFVDRRAERLRQAVLKRAFVGRLVPQDAEEDVAESMETARAANTTLRQGRLFP